MSEPRCGFRASLWFQSLALVSQPRWGVRASLWFQSLAVASQPRCGFRASLWCQSLVVVSEKLCPLPPEQVNGGFASCDGRHEYHDTCTYKCNSGFKLPAGGVWSVKCTVRTHRDGRWPTMEWSDTPSDCTGESATVGDREDGHNREDKYTG